MVYDLNLEETRKNENTFCIRHFEIACNKSAMQLKLYQVLESDVNGVVWDAALVLGNYLTRLAENDAEFYKKNTNLLELGAGLGFPSIVAGCLGAQNVIATDLEDNLSLLRYNVEQNLHLIKKYGKIQCEPFTWGVQCATKLKNQHAFNIILMADCIYYKESIDDLVASLKVLLDPNGLLLIAQEVRESQIQKMVFRDFFIKTAKFLSINSVPFEDQHPLYRSRDILLFTCTKIT